jgi:radical SAM superfamily enzyme YgiQ (UPF0313 family)
MSKRNLYLVQFNYKYGKGIIMPYSVGVLWSYANQFSSIKKAYKLKDIICIRDEPDTIVDSLESPDVVAFSVSVWNYEISLAVANKIKKQYPDCLIVLGGPHVPDKVGNFFIENSFIDILVHGEGEVIFREILEKRAILLDKSDLKGIEGASFKIDGGGGYIRRDRMADINIVPSPYLNGVFDDLMKSDLDWQPVWETNRGCPYQCVYCDWGSNFVTKLKKFDIDRLEKEIEWFGVKKIGFIFGGDANFGILKRDLDIAKMLVNENKKTSGFPSKFRVSYAKNSTDRVTEIAELLHTVSMDKGITLSVQSLDEDCLEATKRKNLPVESLSNFVKHYQDKSIGTYTELIMGLPGETYETFLDGVDQLLSAGIHNSLAIYNCTILPNAPMNEESYMKEWKIETVRSPIFLNHSSPSQESITEYEEVVIGNKLLPREDWINEVLFSWTIQSFHALNLTQVIAIAFNKIYKRKYSEFYKELLLHFANKEDTTIGQELKLTRSKVESTITGGDWDTFIDEFGPINWSIEEASYLRLLSQLEKFYSEIRVFMIEHSLTHDINLDLEILDNVIAYQHEIVVEYNDTNDSVFVLDYPIHSAYKEWLMGREFELRKRKNSVTISNKDKYDDLEDHAKRALWWGRKGSNFTHNNITESFVEVLVS